MAHAAAPFDVDLAPGPLQDALAHLAAITRLQVLYDPAIVGGRLTEGAKGVMTAAQALERLLAGTGLSYRFTADDAVAVIREPLASAPRLAHPAGRATEPLPETITITGLRPLESSAADPTVSAMKVEVPALNSPVTSMSVPGQVLRDEQADRIEDVLEQISGIEAAPDGQSTLGFSLRGIPTYQYYVDGVRVSPDLHHDGFRDLANVERIDIVKGPASTLYGRTAPGGLINVVTKQPLAERSFSVEQRASAFGRLRTQIDAGGPLSRPSLRYRLNAAYERGGSFRELSRNQREFFSSVVTWSPVRWSQTTGYFEFLRSDDPLDSGLPLIGSSLPAVPLARSVEKGGEVRTRDLRAGVRGALDLSPSLTLRYHFDARWLRTPQRPQLALSDDELDPANCMPGACPVSRALLSIPRSTGRTLYSSLELQGSAELARTRHSLLIGAEFFDTRDHNEVLYSTADYPTDLFSPGRAVLPAALSPADGAYSSTVLERWTSGYLQDLISVGDAFHLLLGVRYDYVREWLDSAAGIPLVDSGSDELWDHAIKRRAGLVWHPLAPMSVYADYTENFGISRGIYGTGKGGTGLLVPPESAHQWEAGIKIALDERLVGSIEWFELTQVNIALPVFNPLQDAQGFKTLTGAARTRGVELDLRGSIAPGLQLVGSYAFLDSRILADAGTIIDANGQAIPTTGNTGNRLFGIPRHGGSLWATYHFAGALSGLRIGLGAVARSWRYGDNSNDYTLPGFSRCKLLVAYSWALGDATLGAQLNVDNLFNTRYFESVSGTHTVMPGWPRRWVVGLRWQR